MDLLQILDGGFASQVSHEVDGLIFQPVPDVSPLVCPPAWLPACTSVCQFVSMLQDAKPI